MKRAYRAVESFSLAVERDHPVLIWAATIAIVVLMTIGAALAFGPWTASGVVAGAVGSLALRALV